MLLQFHLTFTVIARMLLALGLNTFYHMTYEPSVKMAGARVYFLHLQKPETAGRSLERGI